MLLHALVPLLYLIAGSICDPSPSPRIVIVGAGASGIAAASKLIENGFENVLILEAENRIGGRVHTVEFDDYVVDLGAQWVHGEKGNVAYQLAAPLGLIEHATMESQLHDTYATPGVQLDEELVKNLSQFYLKELDKIENFTNEYNGSIGDYYVEQFKEFFKQHPEINETLAKDLLWHYNLMQTGLDPANTWFDISANGYSSYQTCEGDHIINWKERGYSTVLDILMKKIPNPEEELPVLNKTIFNAEVTKVDYTNEDGIVKITTADGKEYEADHVIMTPSLGVLKAQYETLFDPPLSETKVNSIKGLGFGAACKIILAFNETWWGDRNKDRSGFTFLWSENERRDLARNPETKWMPSLLGFFFVQYKPRILLGWVSGEGAQLIDEVSDEQVFNQTVYMLNNFLGKDYNVTEPIAMIRSDWYTNKHFRGSYSFRSMETERTNASARALAEPIVKKGKPVVLFGGEASNDHHFSTVHGAIAVGWREADRIIHFYNGNNSSNGEGNI